MNKDAIFMYFLYLIFGIIALYFIVMNFDKILLNLLFFGLDIAAIWVIYVVSEKMIKNGISDSVAMLTALAIIILGIILIMFIVPESILDRVFG